MPTNPVKKKDPIRHTFVRLDWPDGDVEIHIGEDRPDGIYLICGGYDERPGFEPAVSTWLERIGGVSCDSCYERVRLARGALFTFFQPIPRVAEMPSCPPNRLPEVHEMSWRARRDSCVERATDTTVFTRYHELLLETAQLEARKKGGRKGRRRR